MKKKLIQLPIILLTILSACTKEVKQEDVDIDIPVVEAFLEPGKDISVQLSKMVPFLEEGYEGSSIIKSEEVYINYNGTDYLLFPISNSPGKYASSDTNLVAVSGGLYSLFFDYNGSSVSSITTIPSKPFNIGLSFATLEIDTNEIGAGSTIDPLIVSWGNTDNSYHQVIVEYIEPTYDPINENLNSDNYANLQKVATEPVLANSYELTTRQHLFFFGTYRIIIYKINEEYVNLYENISQSSLSLTEPLTNIENGLGIFTGLNSDTLILEIVGI